MTAADVMDAITLMLESFPRVRRGERTDRVYATALAKYHPADVVDAITHLIPLSKSIPTIFDIITAITSNSEGQARQRMTRLHATMCVGMSKAEIDRYFAAHAIHPGDIDMDYFREFTQSRERGRAMLMENRYPGYGEAKNLAKASLHMTDDEARAHIATLPADSPFDERGFWLERRFLQGVRPREIFTEFYGDRKGNQFAELFRGD